MLTQSAIRLNNEIEKYSIFMQHQVIPAAEKGDRIDHASVMEQIEASLISIKRDLQAVNDQIESFRNMNLMSEADEQQHKQATVVLVSKLHQVQRSFEDHRSKFKRYQREYSQQLEDLKEQKTKMEKYAPIF